MVARAVIFVASVSGAPSADVRVVAKGRVGVSVPLTDAPTVGTTSDG